MGMILPDPFPAASAAARKHAEIEWPNESIGFVIEGGEYVPLVNVHPDPQDQRRSPSFILTAFEPVNSSLPMGRSPPGRRNTTCANSLLLLAFGGLSV
jgi:hypothetical protein